MAQKQHNVMAENLSYNPYIDMHNDVQLSAMFFGHYFWMFLEKGLDINEEYYRAGQRRLDTQSQERGLRER